MQTSHSPAPRSHRLGVPVGPLNQSLLGQRALRPIEGSNPAIYIDLCLRLCSLPSPYYPVSHNSYSPFVGSINNPLSTIWIGVSNIWGSYRTEMPFINEEWPAHCLSPTSICLALILRSDEELLVRLKDLINESNLVVVVIVASTRRVSSLRVEILWRCGF